MSRRKVTVRPKRTAKNKTARQQLQALKDGVSSAVEQLNVAHEDLGEVDAFVFVCMQALRAKEGDDMSPSVATVLDAACEKLVLDVNRNIREALKALGQDGGQ